MPVRRELTANKAQTLTRIIARHSASVSLACTHRSRSLFVSLHTSHMHAHGRPHFTLVGPSRHLQQSGAVKVCWQLSRACVRSGSCRARTNGPHSRANLCRPAPSQASSCGPGSPLCLWKRAACFQPCLRQSTAGHQRQHTWPGTGGPKHLLAILVRQSNGHWRVAVLQPMQICTL